MGAPTSTRSFPTSTTLRLCQSARMTRSSWSVDPTAAVRARLSKCTARSTSSTSSVVITKLKLDKDRRSILERKNTQKAAEKGKGKYTEGDVKKEVELD